MPIYEYRCSACGYELEKIQKITDQPLIDCPQCNTANLHKLISKAAFKLTGSGWYETDFKGSKASTSENNPVAASTSVTTGEQAASAPVTAVTENKN